MPSFHVRFKGMLNKSESERLDAAGIVLDGRESSELGGIPGAGRPVYRVRVEASSAEEALTLVREALDPDTGNFSEWKSGPT
ncbi:MAG TPA: hypothetical protein VI039_07495 [Solirubrobacterales bacterium]